MDDVWSSAVLAFGAFAVVSHILRRYPLLLHNRKPATAWGTASCVSHRGGRESTPENTISSFAEAIRLTDAIELDVWLTADGEVAVLHDGDLNRVCGIDRHIRDIHSAELPEVLQEPSDGWRQGAGEGLSPQKMQLLRPVMQLCAAASGDFRVMIEFKQKVSCTPAGHVTVPADAAKIPELREKVLAIIQETGMLRRTCCFSLDADVNRQLQDEPAFQVCCSASECLTVYLWYYTGLLPFVPTSWLTAIFGITLNEYKDLSLPRRVPALAVLPDAMLWRIVGLAPAFFSQPALFRHLNARGIPVWVLGVNDDAKMAKCIRLGVNTVLTDDPQWYATLPVASRPRPLASSTKAE